MSVEIQGNPVNQITGLAAPARLDHAVRAQDSALFKAWVQGLDLNLGAPIDFPNQLFVGSPKYIPVRAYVYNPTADLHLATIGLFTASGGGGTQIIAPVALSSITGVGTFQVLSIAALSSAITATALVPRLTVAAGSPGTASLYLEYVDLSLI